ncbi:Uu.00g138320.m01.CDS01 [Anthostomella pinea]|uniref:Uu.00g138320.m01.CDS01 n=1 Tax=Anthostomella pinea TaxID=933095 RepID=A0AAI8YIS4_9PEZI|nr:Uu.00g138320.m01.CDS01 [Anthostomella pinea]
MPCRDAPEQSKGVGTEFHGFMDLPREIRDMVYAYRLVRGSVFLPNAAGGHVVIYGRWRTRDYYRQPYGRYAGLPADWGEGYASGQHIGLISGVSKTIHQEAAPLFYGGNRFVFPYGNTDFASCYDRVRLPWYHDYFDMMRDISITFDMRDQDDQATDLECRYHSGPGPDEYDDEDAVPPGTSTSMQLDYMVRLHREKNSTVETQYDERLRHTVGMTLDRLQLSFEECYCGLGCCRKVNYVLDNLCLLSHWEVRPPKLIEVFGWNNETERERIEQELKGLTLDGEPIPVRFVGKSMTEVRTDSRAAERRRLQAEGQIPPDLQAQGDTV